jgi:hypothetical protein
MAINITLLLLLLSYSMVASQSFMYMLALKQLQLGVNGHVYTEIRKRLDTYMRSNFTYVVYAALFSNLTLLILTFRNPGSLLFLMAAIAFMALLADTWLTLKRSLPINDRINTWSADSTPSDWEEYRFKWLRIFRYRQVANLTGFLALLVGAVFG